MFKNAFFAEHLRASTCGPTRLIWFTKQELWFFVHCFGIGIQKKCFALPLKVENKLFT